jgi:two-component system, LytTR family, response regulator LytT
MKAVILEDELLIANYLKKILLKYGVTDVEITTGIDDAKAALANQPDFYVLDIRISPKETSLDFAKYLNQLSIPFFFITANDEKETMVEATSNNPIGYITKPFKESDVEAILELIKLKLVAQKEIELSSYKGKMKISESDILYCQAEGVYTRVFTQDKEYTQRITLKEFHKKLNSSTFQRLHKSYVVNMEKVSEYTKDNVIINNQTIPISRTYNK